MTSGTGQQIKSAYEIHGKTPEFIAQDLGLDETAVKAYLMQNSPVYRKDCSREPEGDDSLNFSEDQLRTVNDIIFETALHATLPDGSVDHRTRLKAAVYVRDDKKKRLDNVHALKGGPTMNLLFLNESIQQARALAEESSSTDNNQIVEIEEIKAP